MRITAELLLIGKNRMEVRKCLGKIFDNKAEVAVERFYGNKSGASFDARVRGRHADAVPFFFLRIFYGKKESFARSALDVALLTRGKNNQTTPSSIVAIEAVNKHAR